MEVKQLKNPFGSFKVFKLRTIYLLIASCALLGLGIFLTYASTIVTLSPLPLDTGLLLLTVITFSFGFLFFGYIAPVILFFVGMHIGCLLRFSLESTPFIIGAIACSLLACYAAVRLGDALLDDMRGKGNFKAAWQITLIVLGIALVIAFSLDFTLAG